MEWPPFHDWTVTVLDYNGIPVAAERDYGPNLEGHASRFLDLYNWTLRIKGESPWWWGQAATLEQAEMDADRAATSDLVQRQAQEWVDRPFDKPMKTGQHQSTLRIQEYRRPR